MAGSDRHPSAITFTFVYVGRVGWSTGRLRFLFALLGGGVSRCRVVRGCSTVTWAQRWAVSRALAVASSAFAKASADKSRLGQWHRILAQASDGGQSPAGVVGAIAGSEGVMPWPERSVRRCLAHWLSALRASASGTRTAVHVEFGSNSLAVVLREAAWVAGCPVRH